MRDEEMLAEIEDFIEGFNHPTYRGMRINGVRVATWSSAVRGRVTFTVKKLMAIPPIGTVGGVATGSLAGSRCSPSVCPQGRLLPHSPKSTSLPAAPARTAPDKGQAPAPRSAHRPHRACGCARGAGQG